MPRYFSCIKCGAISTERHCPEHKPKPRASFRDRGYGKEFEANRRVRLRLNPWCCECGKKANTADHIKRKRDGGSDELSNLRSMCSSCHSKHTASESPGGWNRRTA